MKTFLKTNLALCVAGALALAAPPVEGADSNEYWDQGQAELQKNLKPGQPANFYQKKIEDLGYKITSTNYSNDDYLEYEVVKGDQTWEVQIDIDDDNRRATQVDVAMNAWKTEATERALQNAMPAAGTAATAKATRANRYSDRDRSRVDAMINELEAMPVGRDKEFYKDTLRQKGYEIGRINTDDDDDLVLEAVKNGRSVALDIDFDESTGKSEEIDASTLWAESEATTQTREAQEMGATKSKKHVSESREMDRRSRADDSDNR